MEVATTRRTVTWRNGWTVRSWDDSAMLLLWRTDRSYLPNLYRYTWILSSLNFWRDGADRSFCRAYLEERNGPEAQMAMAVRNRCDNGCAGLAGGLQLPVDQEDMDELDGVGQQWLLFPVDGLVLLLDRL